jgi:hypothetical protein
MLDDADETRLQAIEQRLVQQDAAFVDRLRQRGTALPPTAVPPADLRPLGEVLRYAAVLLVLLLLADGSHGGALVLLLLTAAGRACWAPSRAAARSRLRDAHRR